MVTTFWQNTSGGEHFTPGGELFVHVGNTEDDTDTLHKAACFAEIAATRPRLLKQVEQIMLLCLRMDTVLEEECDKEARVQKLLAILNGPRYTEDEWSAHRKTEREEADRQELLKNQNAVASRSEFTKYQDGSYIFGRLFLSL